MATIRRAKPPKGNSVQGQRVIRAARPKGTTPGQLLSNFTVVWVDRNGVPFDTTGFFLRVFRNGRRIGTFPFDRNGVAITNIDALTRTRLTIRTFNSRGVLFRTRTVPAGVEVFAIIG